MVIVTIYYVSHCKADMLMCNFVIMGIDKLLYQVFINLSFYLSNATNNAFIELFHQEYLSLSKIRLITLTPGLSSI